MTRREQIEQASIEHQMQNNPKAIGGDAFADMIYKMNINPSFIAGAEWADEHPKLYSVTRKAVERALGNLWYDAQSDDLPEIDREVIVLCDNGKVCFGHRPNPDGWDGKNIITGEVSHYTPQTYDKGGWNIPDVKWWLDIELPNIE